jgi:hypothetical protein
MSWKWKQTECYYDRCYITFQDCLSIRAMPPLDKQDERGILHLVARRKSFYGR